MIVGVVGASGFVGKGIVQALSIHNCVAFLREVPAVQLANVESRIFTDLMDFEDKPDLLSGIDVVVHTAGRSNSSGKNHATDLAFFRKMNVEGSLILARQAASVGVKRFIFISSIKVNGEHTPLGQPFTADDAPAPEDAYGISKWEAEQGLQKLASETGLEVVIIRPPLVYGLGVKGNFARMIKFVAKALPMPFGSIHNKRSLVAIDNLVDLIITCIDHPAAANQVFLVGDGKDLSTSELLRGVANLMNKPSRLIPVPSSLLMLTATLLGKKAVAQRLLGSLQVDISKTHALLGWEPRIPVEEGLRRCVVKN